MYFLFLFSLDQTKTVAFLTNTLFVTDFALNFAYLGLPVNVQPAFPPLCRTLGNSG